MHLFYYQAMTAGHVPMVEPPVLERNHLGYPGSDVDSKEMTFTQSQSDVEVRPVVIHPPTNRTRDANANLAMIVLLEILFPLDTKSWLVRSQYDSDVILLKTENVEVRLFSAVEPAIRHGCQLIALHYALESSVPARSREAH
jgi:hypothetical protein